jgi:hypothetical protein
VSLENWSNLGNPVQIRSESYSPLPPAVEPAEQRAASGILFGLLPGAAEEDPARKSQGHLVVQRRYTEDWVLHRGYQQHRRTPTSWNFEDFGEEAGQDEASRIRGHRRDISNAKTITPADFQQSRSCAFLSVPGAVVSSDHESVLSGVTSITGRYKTAPQSLADLPTDYAMDLPKLSGVPSRWADLTPSPIEDKAVNGFKADAPTQAEATPKVDANGTANGTVANYLLSAPKATPTSRTSTPGSRKSIKWHGKNVFIHIPSETQFGLPGGPPIPLTKEEIEKRMKGWIEQGYSIEIGGQGACKEIYPEERKGKVDSSDIFVSIPDPRGVFTRSDFLPVFGRRSPNGLSRTLTVDRMGGVRDRIARR